MGQLKLSHRIRTLLITSSYIVSCFCSATIAEFLGKLYLKPREIFSFPKWNKLGAYHLLFQEFVIYLGGDIEERIAQTKAMLLSVVQ